MKFLTQEAPDNVEVEQRRPALARPNTIAVHIEEHSSPCVRKLVMILCGRIERAMNNLTKQRKIVIMQLVDNNPAPPSKKGSIPSQRHPLVGSSNRDLTHKDSTSDSGKIGLVVCTRSPPRSPLGRSPGSSRTKGTQGLRLLLSEN